MRLVKLKVNRFQCIDEALLELGPGLNVLFGPNDLGKSSLAWAIRAVLLLPHGSAFADRFISWYGGGDPEVELTFADPSGRYWRVKKTFGGSAGRSSLESSKDGVTFSSDANGRQVDEKLRKLLGWGLSAPGGTGGQRGLPDSFLVQVLVSEQDSVRKVLFETSLDDDPDESGRARLAAALDALAQDPLFKSVLEGAQAQVDKAFTATGRKKKAAGSPFVAVAERIKKIDGDLEALDAKVRETTAAQARITELLGRRDEVTRQLETARERLQHIEAGLDAAKRRAALRSEIASHRATLDEATALRASIAAGERDQAELAAALTQQAQQLGELKALVNSNLAEQKSARERVEAALLDEQGTVARDRLEARLQTQREHHQRAKSDVERRREHENSAGAALAALAAAERDKGQLVDIAKTAAGARETARESAEKAARELEAARDRLRDVTSQDQAQARELRRAEVERAVLEKNVAVAEHVEVLRRIEAIRALSARVTEHENAFVARAKALDVARESLAQIAGDLDAVQARRAHDTLLQRAGELRIAKAELADVRKADEQLEHQQGLARALAEKARDLRGSIPVDLPSPAEFATVRKLDEDLRIANARLGGGLSVFVRRKRNVSIETRADDAPPVASEGLAVVTASANQSMLIAVGDLVEIEITAGEEDARREAASLKKTWESEALPVIARARASSVDDLAAMFTTATEARREADAAEREARSIAERLTESPRREAAPVLDRITGIEAALSQADAVMLDAELNRLGEKWSDALSKRLDAAEKEAVNLAGKLDVQRVEMMRLETLLGPDRERLRDLEQELETMQAELGGDPAAMHRLHSGVADQLRREISQLEALRAELQNAGDDVEKTRLDLARIEKVAEAARSRFEVAEANVRDARDRLVEATSKTDGARARVKELDTAGASSALLDAGQIPGLEPWTEQTRRAETVVGECERACKATEDALADGVREKAEAIENARKVERRVDQMVVNSQNSERDAGGRLRTIEAGISEKRVSNAELRTRLAALRLDEVESIVAKLTAELDATPGDDSITEAGVEESRRSAKGLEGGLAEVLQELAKANGALEQVGGAMVHAQQREHREARDIELRREHELEVEFDAWKLLAETLREAETTSGAHLGKALAAPVTQRFRELTENRYGALELGPHLDASGVQVEGQARELAVLSAGTQDQLATLLRLCVAEQLESGIVLDDHLTQSDPRRVAWFNSLLRNAALRIQVTFITCRPSELLGADEFPGADDVMRASAAGQVRAIDLTKVIKRFAASKPKAPVGKRELQLEPVEA